MPVQNSLNFFSIFYRKKVTAFSISALKKKMATILFAPIVPLNSLHVLWATADMYTLWLGKKPYVKCLYVHRSFSICTYILYGQAWSHIHGSYSTACTVNPALLASSFVWQIQLYFLHISLFKIIKRKYFIQSKCEFMKFLFVLLDKINILPLYTVYLPHQLLHMLFFAPFRNFWAKVFLN